MNPKTNAKQEEDDQELLRSGLAAALKAWDGPVPFDIENIEWDDFMARADRAWEALTASKVGYIENARSRVMATVFYIKLFDLGKDSEKVHPQCIAGSNLRMCAEWFMHLWLSSEADEAKQDGALRYF